MKHQIVFLSGQILPIYIGIKEFKPNKVHFFASQESKDRIIVLKELFKDLIFSEFVCDPFDFYVIRKQIEKIIFKIDSSDDILINLTCGTKIMLLAAQSIVQNMNIKAFYINQDNTWIDIPSYIKQSIESKLTIKDFFELSGHKIFSAKHLSDIDKSEFKVSKEIELFSDSSKLYSKITNLIRKKYKSIPEKGIENFTDNVSIRWDSSLIQISRNNKLLATFNGTNIKELFFNAGWWELTVASEVSKWLKVNELLLNCELPFRTDDNILKNEIDIVLNTGNKLIFIECKSGIIKQDDINKMKIIRQTYGGIASKSLLVSRFMPSQSVVEKCKELDIELYCLYLSKIKINPLNNINRVLDKLDKKNSI